MSFPSKESIEKLREGWSECFNIPLDDISIESHSLGDSDYLRLRFWTNYKDNPVIRTPLIHVHLWDAVTGYKTAPMMCVVGKIQ